jgi:hypothetical protein
MIIANRFAEVDLDNDKQPIIKKKDYISTKTLLKDQHSIKIEYVDRDEIVYAKASESVERTKRVAKDQSVF